MMAKTYTQLIIHVVFAVKNRDALLTKDIRDKVYTYMGGILQEMKHKPLIINGTSNHVHILFGYNPSKAISDTVHGLKRNTSLFINREKLAGAKFSWQEGYGAFSCSKSQLDRIYKYIQNQEEHHKKRTFRNEYLSYLKNLKIDYNEKYLFDFIQDV